MRVFFAFIIIAVVSLAYSAPVISSISDTVGHGASITISGTGFGIKAKAAPAKYDNFENGQVRARHSCFFR